MKKEDEQVRESRTESDGMAENAHDVRPMSSKGVMRATMVGRYASEEVNWEIGVPCLLDGRCSQNQRPTVHVRQTHDNSQLSILPVGRDKVLSTSPAQMLLF